MTFNIDIELDITCRMCGEALSATEDRRGGVEVDPCEKCLRDADNEGYQRGMEEEGGDE